MKLKYLLNPYMILTFIGWGFIHPFIINLNNDLLLGIFTIFTVSWMLIMHYQQDILSNKKKFNIKKQFVLSKISIIIGSSLFLNFTYVTYQNEFYFFIPFNILLGIVLIVNDAMYYKFKEHYKEFIMYKRNPIEGLRSYKEISKYAKDN